MSHLSSKFSRGVRLDMNGWRFGVLGLSLVSGIPLPEPNPLPTKALCWHSLTVRWDPNPCSLVAGLAGSNTKFAGASAAVVQ